MGDLEQLQKLNHLDAIGKVMHKMKPSVTFLGIKESELIIQQFIQKSKEKNYNEHIQHLFTEFIKISQQFVEELQEKRKKFLVVIIKT